MNVASILGKSYRLTNTSATTFLDGNAANVLSELNTLAGHRTLNILNVRVDINSFIKEVYTDLVSADGLVAGDVGFNGEYPFDTDVLRPVREEISYDALTWNPAEVYDLNDNIDSSEFNEDQIQATYTESYPYVRFERDSYFVRPLKTTVGDITAGIHLWYEKRQTDMTTGSPEFEQNLHDVLSYDLAALEMIMHPNRHIERKPFFDQERIEVNKLFNEFYKNRFKRDMTFNIDYNNPNIDYT